MPLDLPVIQPPAIYLAAPTRVVTETILPAPDVARICLERSVAHRFAAPPPGKQFLGCSVMFLKRCDVVRIDREDVRVHELGHCSGWPADHPGGR